LAPGFLLRLFRRSHSSEATLGAMVPIQGVVSAMMLTSIGASLKAASYVKMPLETNGCDAESVAVIDEISCRAAAASLGLQFGHSGSDGGAPEGCFYLAREDGVATEVNWNNLGEKTWPDVASVCQHPWGYRKMPLDTAGCKAGFEPVLDEAECIAAAANLLAEFGGNASDSGAPKGCVYVVDDDSSAVEVMWNTRGEKTWKDVASVCRTIALKSASSVQMSPPIVQMPLETNGCHPYPAAIDIPDERKCRAAATSLGVRFGHTGSNGGAPEGCYYTAGDDGKATEISWNNLGEKTWPHAGSVCKFPWGYTKEGVETNGCRAGFDPVIDETSCVAAALDLRLEFGGSVSNSGAPKGCYFLADEERRATMVLWNKRGETTWHDVANVCWSSSQ